MNMHAVYYLINICISLGVNCLYSALILNNSQGTLLKVQY